MIRSDEEGAQADIECNSFAQVYLPLPELEKGRVYAVTFEDRTEGQVEKIAFEIRQIQSPWTLWGRIDESPAMEWTSRRILLKAAETVRPGVFGLFLKLHGVGTFSIREVVIREAGEAEIFVSSSAESSGELLPNPDFACEATGWKLTRATAGGDGLRMLPEPGKPAVVTSEAIVILEMGEDYRLGVTGDAEGGQDLRLELRTFEAKPIQVFRPELHVSDSASQNGGGQSTARTWSQDFTLPVPASGVFQERQPVYVQIQSTQKVLLKRVQITKLGASGEGDPLAGACVRFERDGQLVRRIVSGDPVDVNVVLTGVDDASEEYTVVVRDLAGTTILEIPAESETRNDGTVGFVLQALELPPGWYDTQVVRDGKPLPGVAGELAVCLPTPGDEGSWEFVLGAHLQLWPDGLRAITQEGMVVRPDASERLEDARLIGIESIRLHPPLTTKWWAVELEEGVWDFHDTTVDAPLEGGLSVLGLLDGSARYASSAPDDILEKERPWTNSWGVYAPKTEEDWRRYVRTMVNHFKGRVHAWEIWNEPDHLPFFRINPAVAEGRTPAQVYADLVRSAAEEIHEADPTAIVVAGAVTAAGKTFLIEAIDEGMMEYCDALSFHGYGRAQGAERGAAAFEDMVQALSEKMEAEGWEPEIWDTESSVGATPDGRAGIANARLELKGILARRAAGITRLYLYSGFEKGYPLHADHRMLWGFNDRPLPVQPLLAACQHFLGEAVFVRALSDSDETHVYLFEKDGKPVLAGWSTASESAGFSASEAGVGAFYSETGAPLGSYTGGYLPLDRTVRYFVAD